MSTPRQKEMWRKKMIALEKDIINYFRRNIGTEPDGSFAMSAFYKGYDCGVKAGKKTVAQ